MSRKSERDEHLDGDCLEAFDRLYAYLDGEIKDPEDLARIEGHLSHCRSCFSRAQIEREINERLKTTRSDSVPASLEQRLKKLIQDF
jgi:anti-sigma factor (TIGR02949 family)